MLLVCGITTMASPLFHSCWCCFHQNQNQSTGDTYIYVLIYDMILILFRLLLCMLVYNVSPPGCACLNMSEVKPCYYTLIHLCQITSLSIILFLLHSLCLSTIIVSYHINLFNVNLYWCQDILHPPGGGCDDYVDYPGDDCTAFHPHTPTTYELIYMGSFNCVYFINIENDSVSRCIIYIQLKC